MLRWLRIDCHETSDLAPPPGVGSGHARVKDLFVNTVCDLSNEAAQRPALQAKGADAATIERVRTLLARRDRSVVERLIAAGVTAPTRLPAVAR